MKAKFEIYAWKWRSGLTLCRSFFKLAFKIKEIGHSIWLTTREAFKMDTVEHTVHPLGLEYIC